MSGRVLNFVGGRLSGGGGDLTITHLEIVTPPDKVDYKAYEVFDPTGMVVLEHYSDGTSEECLGYTYKTDGLMEEDTALTISFTWRGMTVTTTQPITVTMPMDCYGVQWESPESTVLSRTDLASEFTNPVPYVAGATNCSSPFDDIYPWSDMVPVTDPVAGELVAIPKYWFRWSKSGDKLKLQISPKETVGFYVSPAHADRGDGKGERDVVYVGRYMCDANWKSTKGAPCAVMQPYSSIFSSISALGEEFFAYDYAMHWTIAMLYLVEFADWDMYKVIGEASNHSNSTTFVCGNFDGVYHTGTTSADRTTAGTLQYRYIEALNNATTAILGARSNDSGILIEYNPVEATNNGRNYTNIGLPYGGETDAGTPIAFDICTVPGFEWAIYPTASGLASGIIGTKQTWRYRKNSVMCRFYLNSGVYNGTTGMFAFVSELSSADTSNKRSPRLMKLPNPS